MNWSRALSLLVAVGYLIAAAIVLGGVQPRMLVVAAVLAMPLLLIWFPDFFGNYTGPVRGGYIDQKTPAVMVAFAGWFFLVGLPLLLWWLNRVND